ncbi:MAG: LytR C-terminal domain-containing protein [Acidimicrobiia bacterium]|nr:LytR C-terminal domain-containing protein [Acidimicrobiia bacterium]
MIQSIERHDIVNAAALAGALLLCGILLLRWVDYLGEAVGGGLWQADKAESAEDVLNDIDVASVYINGSRPPNEVGVRVANGSEGRNGLAGRGTERLSSFGYGTLTPENKVGDPTDDSYVYYTEGFVLDARQVAAVLEIPETNVVELGTEEIGVTVDGADVIVVLGNNAAI